MLITPSHPSAGSTSPSKDELWAWSGILWISFNFKNYDDIVFGDPMLSMWFRLYVWHNGEWLLGSHRHVLCKQCISDALFPPTTKTVNVYRCHVNQSEGVELRILNETSPKVRCVMIHWASYQVRKIAGCACTGNRQRFPHPPSSKETAG